MLEQEGGHRPLLERRVMEDGDTELARTTLVIFVIKQAPWRTRRGARGDAAECQGEGAAEIPRTPPVVFFIKLVLWRTEA